MTTPHITREERAFECGCGRVVASVWVIAGKPVCCWTCALVLIAAWNEAEREHNYERYNGLNRGGY
jgi:DNA-directed RNA polymerase subunit N (RpoN/RPB10)